MGIIKCKIIGNQVWAVENLTKEQYYMITGRTIPVKNNNWSDFEYPKCYSYESNFSKIKKQFLFDINSVQYFHSFSRDNNTWRIPTLGDLDSLFQYIDGRSTSNYTYSEIPNCLRGTYGWVNNGVNKIGFNAQPNPTLNENVELSEPEIARWWYFYALTIDQKNPIFALQF